MAEIFAGPEAVLAIDETAFPGRGEHPIGVRRQHCGASGEEANCQAAVGVQHAAPKGPGPLARRLQAPRRGGRPGPVPGRKAEGQVAPGLLD